MNVSPGTTRIGWIGAGVMGGSMCGHLLDAGYAVTLFTRTRAKAEALLERGAAWADSPRAVAERSDVVVSIVGYPEDVEQVTLGEGGALAALADGGVLIDMTTSRPELAERIAAAAAERGVASVDAPVSGGDLGARNGTLSIMIGGDGGVVRDLGPIWETLGARWVHQGPPGAGQHTKMANQTLVAGTMISVCEALLYAYKAGLDLDRVLESVASGAAGSWTLSNLAPRMIAGDFAPGFFIEHFLKDMRIVLAEAQRMELRLPGLELALRFYEQAEADGAGRDGTQALIRTLAKLSAVDWEGRG